MIFWNSNYVFWKRINYIGRGLPLRALLGVSFLLRSAVAGRPPLSSLAAPPPPLSGPSSFSCPLISSLWAPGSGGSGLTCFIQEPLGSGEGPIHGDRCVEIQQGLWRRWRRWSGVREERWFLLPQRWFLFPSVPRFFITVLWFVFSRSAALRCTVFGVPKLRRHIMWKPIRWLSDQNDILSNCEGEISSWKLPFCWVFLVVAI